MTAIIRFINAVRILLREHKNTATNKFDLAT